MACIDAVVATASAAVVIVDLAAEWMRAYHSIPKELEELRLVCASVKSATANLILDDSIRPVVEALASELTTCECLVRTLMKKRKRIFFTARGTLQSILEHNEMVRERLKFLLELKAARGAARFNALDNIRDPEAREWWHKHCGDDKLSVKLEVFSQLIGQEYARNMSPEDTPGRITAFLFDAATCRKGLAGFLEACKAYNPFSVSWAAKRASCLGTDASKAPPSRTKTRLCDLSAGEKGGNSELSCFYIASDLPGGFCLAPYKSQMAAGVRLVIVPLARGDDSQQWRLDKRGCLRNLGTGLCLDIEKENVVGGTPAVQALQKDGSDTQQWAMHFDGTIRSYADPSLCLDVNEGKAVANTLVILWRASNRRPPGQRWRVVTDPFFGHDVDPPCPSTTGN